MILKAKRLSTATSKAQKPRIVVDDAAHRSATDGLDMKAGPVRRPMAGNQVQRSTSGGR